jgi:tetratricopeptide (TPR) repeat protein
MEDQERTPGTPRAWTAAVIVVVGSLCLAWATARAVPPAPVLIHPEAARRAARLAIDIRSNEEMGGYAQAAEELRRLRALAPVDPDLDLALALDLARAGRLDSAAAMLYDTVLSAAMTDTLLRGHFEIYGWRHEQTYFGGKFDGWYWYIARARLEVEASRGHWPEALAAARICVRARPLAGIEWYLFALCAARGGAYDEALPAVERAGRLAPILPETHYLAGVLNWRGGHRVAAQMQFRFAISMDSTYREPAVALVRARLPVLPDTLPSRLLTGLRQAELVTSAVRPKYDEFIQMDRQAVVIRRTDITIPDSLAGRIKPVTVHPLVLFDERGHAVIHEDRWAASTSAPETIVGLVSAAVRGWDVSPAIRLGHPQGLWLELDINLVARKSQGD